MRIDVSCYTLKVCVGARLRQLTFPPLKTTIRVLPLGTKRGQSVLALDDKYDDIKKLIDTGKEKGY